MRIVVLAMLLPVALSLAGPIYYGYTNGPYWRVIIWALACTIGFLWLNRSSINPSSSAAINALNVVLISLTVAAAFLIGDSIVYLLTHLISK